MRKAAHKNNQLDYERAQDLRRKSTPYEQKLWRELQLLSKGTGFKFRRQHPFHPYIADFVCLEVGLVIELDGASHDSRQDYDTIRDSCLEKSGFKILRFPNRDVASNIGSIVETILKIAQALKNAGVKGNPSPAKTKDLASQAQVFASSPSRGEEL